jgi:1,4-dihydroxy-2-naphthoate octaprenyltransferase
MNKSSKVNSWISAFRLRTLPLAIAAIGLGNILAAANGNFQWDVCALSFATAILLQILSNLANDYGDSIHGADHVGRIGPARAVQSGEISKEEMKSAVSLFWVLTIIAGIILLWVSNIGLWLKLGFLILGIISAVAATQYTSGKSPYGYKGLGDVSVFFFFGWVGVVGSYVLQIGTWQWDILLPASTISLFSMAVLNLNNMRDLNSDKIAGKLTLPVRYGIGVAKTYHWILMLGGLMLSIIYMLVHSSNVIHFLFVLVLPVLIRIGIAVSKRKDAASLDPLLKFMALTTVFFVFLFGIGIWLGGALI